MTQASDNQPEIDGVIDSIIRRLYTSVLQVPPESYRQWALEQLHQAIDFDAALWGTGLLATKTFHYVAQLNVAQLNLDESYAQQLINTLDINPIRHGILNNMGRPVAMSDVYADEFFYQSAIYAQLFKPYGIERVLSSGHYDTRSGLSTLISLYRKDRERMFTEQDKVAMARLLPHLIGATTHAYFIHLERHQPAQDHAAAAICDQQGFYYEVQDRFLDLIENSFPDYRGNGLPFALPVPETELQVAGLIAKSAPFGKLFVLYIRPLNPRDTLTEREKQIVSWITRGLSFKEVAKKLEVAPSTVSNHLYRIYRKLGISSRTELAQLFL